MTPDPFKILRGPRLAVALLFLIIGGGTAGYVLIEGWPIWDAFYMTVITMTTVGYLEVYTLSFGGQVFTVVLILSGVGTAFYTATLIVTLLVEGGLHRGFAQRRFMRMLEQITDHFILCGYGRIGSIIAGELHQQGVPFVVIERNPDRLRGARERGWLVVEADDAERKLRQAGADRVISPYHIGANHMVQTALRPAVVDFVHVATSSANLDLSMEQVHVREGSNMAGKSIIAAGIRQQFGVIVVSIKRAGGAMEFNPEPEAVIRGGDELVVLGKTGSIKVLEESIGGKAAAHA